MARSVMIARRLMLLVLVVASTSGGAWLMSVILSANGWTVLHVVIEALFTLSFGGLMISSWTGMMRF